MNILITGSTGYIGKRLTPRLIKSGHSILEITIEPDISNILYNNQTLKHTISDRQEDLVSTIEEFNPEIVIHLAAHLTPFDDYKSMITLLDANIIFLCRLLDALKNCKVCTFINTGTSTENYNGKSSTPPAYLYSATKTASRSFIDYYSKVYKFKQITVVPYTIYGGIDTAKKIINLIVDSTSSSKPIDLSQGKQVLDFIHIDDVVLFYLKLIDNLNNLPQKISFELGTGKGHSLRQIAELVEKTSNLKTNINWGGKPYRPNDVMHAVANIQKQRELLNWEPQISIEEGIRRYFKDTF